MDPDQMTKHPKVFISHANADKDRFVLDFAVRLRNNGVDAWVDQWEMNPGDSLVDKIFEEGLGNCQAMIVVLSKHSIQSKWVREELDAAVVRKIEKATRLIPVRLDECDVPECLKHCIWQDVSDPASYDSEFKRILNSIYGQYEKPPIGEPPPYIQAEAPELEGLSKIDSTIFALCCNRTFEVPYRMIEEGWLAAATEALGISMEHVVETQEVLDIRGYAEVAWTLGPKHICSMTLTERGFNQFARTHPDYKRALESVGLMIVRDGASGSHEMMEKSDLPPRLVEHALFVLESRGLIRTTSMMGGTLLWTTCLRSFAVKLKGESATEQVRMLPEGCCAARRSASIHPPQRG